MLRSVATVHRSFSLRQSSWGSPVGGTAVARPENTPSERRSSDPPVGHRECTHSCSCDLPFGFVGAAKEARGISHGAITATACRSDRAAMTRDARWALENVTHRHPQGHDAFGDSGGNARSKAG